MSTKIQWTDETWNPIIGCSHAAYQPAEGGPKRAHPGCTSCYAETFCSRGLLEAHAEASKGGKWTGKIVFQPERLSWPFERWKARKDGTGRRIFVASLSDTGHPGLSDESWAAIQGAMLLSPWNTYQDLTKRPDIQLQRLERWSPAECIDATQYQLIGIVGRAESWGYTLPGKKQVGDRPWSDFPHIHRYVSVSDQATADALIPELLRMPAAVRGVSYEPAVGPVLFDNGVTSWFSCRGIQSDGYCCDRYAERGEHFRGIDHVIVGGESGRNARPFDIQWARDTIRQCRAAGVPCFVKQLGGKPFCRDGEWKDGARFMLARIDVDLRWPLISDPKGGDWDEWPADLRVREHVRVS